MKKFFFIKGVMVILMAGMISCGKDQSDNSYDIDWDSIHDDKRDVYAAYEPEMIAQYDVLKSYVDRSVSPGFILGGAVGLQNYVSKSTYYTLINENFEELTLGYAMKHGAVVRSNGDLQLSHVRELLSLADSEGVTVYGHTLCWHQNQNAQYLNGIIASEIIPLEASMGDNLIANRNFESGSMTGWTGWGNESTRGVSSEGGGLNGAGYALWVNNPALTSHWRAQTSYVLPENLENGALYQLTFWMKGDGAGSILPELQSPDHSNDGFGAVTVSSEWQKVSLLTEVTVFSRNNLIISYGDYLGMVYLDEFELRKVNDLVEVEKTSDEKEQIISDALETWIKQMLDVCSPYVRAWDVVNEPMDDGKPYELKTGIGRASIAADEFFWQDYLGKDYAVLAFNLARKYGNPDDIHFINDYNLEYNLDKTRGLIEYVDYIESKGARVDGIGTQMHISISSDKEKIVEMFELLAATGKLIKVSELDIGVGVQTNDATMDHYIKQAEMFKFVVEKYLEIIPVEQQYGITVWGLTDSREDSFWRAGQPIGLWTEGFERKPAYAGFANGLAGKDVSRSF